MPYLAHAIPAGFSDSYTDSGSWAGHVARQLYQQAYLSGWLSRVWSALTGRPDHLLNLAEVAANGSVNHSYAAGVQVVPISQIQGSQGRCRDFDRNFYPRQDHLKSRWLRVAMAYQLGIILPPVELVQVGPVYFVRDGHHRISVARTLGQTEIEAEVRVWRGAGGEIMNDE